MSGKGEKKWGAGNFCGNETQSKNSDLPLRESELKTCLSDGVRSKTAFSMDVPRRMCTKYQPQKLVGGLERREC